MVHELTTNQESKKQIIAALEALGDASRSFESVSSGIRDTNETFYTKPAPKTYGQMAEIATAAAKEQQEKIVVSRTFPYRPWDGAHATAKALYETWGYAGFGKTIPADLFNPERPPERQTIEVGPGETIEVPWGWLQVPDLNALFKLGAARDRERGILFQLDVECPKLMEKAVTGFLSIVEETLANHSIYKGKAITGAEFPEFIDLSKVNPDHVIYRHNIQESLKHEVWFAIENHELMTMDNQPTRWVTMLDGPFGTGKTLALSLTAQRCQQNGITYIQVRPGKDDLTACMQTAVIYQPAVVAFEDVDTVADPSSTTRVEISHLLDAFDGVRSKGADVQLILTTNHSDRIHPGLLRAGRLHTYLLFGDLDADALLKLLTVKVGEKRLLDIDKDKIYQACTGFAPAFMDLVIQVAKRYALSRNTEKLGEILGRTPTAQECMDYQISTDDLVDAAIRLRPQWQKQKDAEDKEPLPTLEVALAAHIQKAITGFRVLDNDGDAWGQLQPTDESVLANK